MLQQSRTNKIHAPLLPFSVSFLLSYSVWFRTSCLRNGATYSVLGPPTSINNQEIPIDMPTGEPDLHNCVLRLFLGRGRNGSVARAVYISCRGPKLGSRYHTRLLVTVCYSSSGDPTPPSGWPKQTQLKLKLSSTLSSPLILAPILGIND